MTLRLSKAAYAQDEDLEGTCILQNVGKTPLVLLAHEIELPGARPYPTMLFLPRFSESAGIGAQGFGAGYGHRDRGIVPLEESKFRVLAPGESWVYPGEVSLGSTRGIAFGKHSMAAVYSFHRIALSPGYFRTESIRTLWETALETDAESNRVEFAVVPRPR